ncbi:MAG: hypothetical protein AAF531_19875 [Actinomycetota bacterium]
MSTDVRAKPPDVAGSSLRDIVLAAAMKILDREGLHLAPESISYAKVFAHVEETTGVRVTRGSVHERIWASHDDFRREVLEELMVRSLAPNEVIISTEREALLRESARTADDQHGVQVAILKLLSEWSLHQVEESDTYRQIQSAKAIVTRFNDPVAAARMKKTLEVRTDRRLDDLRGLFIDQVRTLGLRVKPELGLTIEEVSDFAYSAGWALMSGSFLNNGAGCRHVLHSVDGAFGGPDDGMPWQVFSLGHRSLFEFFIEPDPTVPWPVRPDGPGDDPSTTAFTPDQKDVQSAGAVTADDSANDDEPRSTDQGAKRRTRGELKQLVLNGGVETLQDLGLNVRPESLSYAAVFAQVYADHGLVVNRASVHKRFWSSHDEFCMDVMGLALRKGLEPDPVLLAEVAALPNEVGRGESKQQLASDALRTIGRFSFEPMMKSREMRCRMLVKSAIPDQPDSESRRVLEELVVKIEFGMVSRLAAMLREKVVDLGYTVRPELQLSEERALQVIAILIHIMSVGSSFEQLVGGTRDENHVMLPRRIGAADSDEWSQSAITGRAAFEMLFQPVGG